MNEEKNRIIASYKLLLSMILVIIISLILIPLSQFIDFEDKGANTSIQVVKTPKVEKLEIADGIHIETGLKVDDGWETVNTNCTRCHSAKIITNNKFTREGWKDLIVWMQETQGLWQLGANETIILDYLSKNYAPGNKKGRRVPLEVDEEDWYLIE